MKLGRMMTLAGGTKNDFDGAKRRELLPFKPKGSYIADAFGVVSEFVKFGPYTLSDAILFKMYLDLARSGLHGKEAQAFARAVSQLGFPPRGISRESYKAPNFLDHDGDDLLVAREVYTANYFNDPRLKTELGFEDGQYFDICHWAGTRSDIDKFIELKNTEDVEDERQTMSLHLYNLSKTVREVRAKAAALAMVEAHDKGPYISSPGYQ